MPSVAGLGSRRQSSQLATEISIWHQPRPTHLVLLLHEEIHCKGIQALCIAFRLKAVDIKHTIRNSTIWIDKS